MKSSKLSNKPKEYIQGWVEFYKLKFKVTPNVLIPRPESELLVDEILNFYTLYPKPLGEAASSAYTLVDIGTGAGNIAISLALHLKDVNVKILATDISRKALRIARQNAKLHGVEDKIIFLKSDLLTSIAQDDNLIIVANLPYIPTKRIPFLDSSVKDFEPRVALDGGTDGFELYRKLFTRISNLQIRPKLIVCEIDYTHGELARNEVQKYFPKASVEVKTDLAKKQRILLIRRFSNTGI